jgi:hypothetical protein
MATKTKTKTKTKKKTLTKNQMRVAIAKDVISQIKTRKIIPQVGVWMEDPKMGSLEEIVSDGVERYLESDDTCRLMPFPAQDYTKKVKNCRVCALGSIFVSSVNLFNGVEFDNGEEVYDCFENLKSSPLNRYFSAEELALIEGCFEGDDGLHADRLNTRDRGVAIAFTSKYPIVKKRLEAIMNNIIKNDGLFKPEQEITKENLLDIIADYMM